MALAAEKGTDWKKITEKKKFKNRTKVRRRQEAENEDDIPIKSSNAKQIEGEGDEEDWQGMNNEEEKSSAESEDEEEETEGVDIDALNDSESESDLEMDDEDDEDIPLSDLEDLPEEEREDLIPHQKQTINNRRALLACLKRIQLHLDDDAPFVTHMSTSHGPPTAESIPDVQDDTKRELSFLSQAQRDAEEARRLLRKEGVPFSRPGDYFAEMAKDDGHMEKVKAKLVQEATNKKAAAEARKLRDLKKFGKQVQVAKLQERAKQKRETLEKIKTLKKRRSDTNGAGLGATEADLFDVGVDNELSRPNTGGSKKRSAPGSGSKHEPNAKRQKKNERFGFGGRKRNSKSGDAISSGDVSDFGRRKSKGKPGGASKRPGKARRKAMTSKK